jgi:hypothetical protein
MSTEMDSVASSDTADLTPELADKIAEIGTRNELLKLSCLEGHENRQRIGDELRRIEVALRDPATSDAHYCQYYAAQQALAWAGNPSWAGSPTNTIHGGKVQARIKDSRRGQEDR